MSKEYKIARVSEQPPREHYNEKYNSTTYYIKVMLEGHDRPVSIGKRSPDALKVGDTINGTILPTTYDTDNFKIEKPAYTPTPKDTSEIKAEWAIGQAVTTCVGLYATDKTSFSLGDIESRAKAYYKMVDIVKSGQPSPTLQQSGYEKAKAQAENIRSRQPSPADNIKAMYTDDEVIDVTGDETIDLDKIPF